ncbi:MAG: B12-binding domain-containing radical SAM protein [Nanoarchaeota archaeon]|nr:B12-binding domain-containing radical SAM protein [Nanoarchaeota archaeon]
MVLRYKKVLFCMPPLPGVFGSPVTPSLSLGYLSEYLSKNKIEHEVMDMRLGYSLQDLKDKIKTFKPDLVGFSSFSFRHDVPYSLINSIKSKDFDIIIGGPHASTIGKKILEETKADYSLKYEGEQLLVDLCNGTDLSQISGLIYRKNNEIIENQHTSFLDIKKLPFPKYKKFELKKYLRKQIHILSSRGCPYDCIYCSIKTTVGKPIRMRESDSVVKEVKYWYNQGYRVIDFIDDNFIFNKQRILDICKKLKETNLTGLKLTCGNGVRADKVDREILTAMKRVGFEELSIGVEVGNNKMLKVIKKGETIEQIENAIKLSTEMGFDVTLFYVIGLPEETEADIQDSINLALKYPINNANFYNAVPFPGTELYDYVKKNNLFVVKDPDYLNTMAHFDDPIFVTLQLSLKQKKKMLKLTKKAEKEILRKTFVRKLKKFGILSEISSYIIFFKPIYLTLQKMSTKFKLFKKTLIFITEKFNLRRMESVR